jgi:plasmid stability protein
MSTITINNIEDDLAARLIADAQRHGRSVEDEVRVILRHALQSRLNPPLNLAESIHAHFAPLGGVDLRLPVREAMREPVDFGQ